MASDASITTRTSPSSTASVSAGTSHRQKRMGPAPFASFEDLSDEVRLRLESPDEKTGFVVRLPGIREDNTPSPAYTMSQPPELVYTGISLVGQIKTPVKPSTSFADAVSNPVSCTSKLHAPNTPRIDISRASSSSHHDSKESSPDREIVGDNHGNDRDQGTTKLGVGFGEDGTLDLRLSTEELDFQDKDQDKRKNKSRPQSPACLNDDSYQNHVRKDSQCSEISLLAISGRTSRLSSIGSVGSAQSRLSNASHLSILSGTTELSRSPSPHKMLLETSFCGTKTPQSTSSTTIDKVGTKTDSDDFEKILLSRIHDPTEAILAEGITLKKDGRCSSMKQAPEKPARRIERRVQSVKSDITIKVDNPRETDSNITPRPTKRIISESGIEYIYIPLKGPLPLDFEDGKIDIPSKITPKTTMSTSSKLITSKPASKSVVTSAPMKLLSQSKSAETNKSRDASPRPSSSACEREEPKYIRIKLKPDHLYENDDTSNIQPDIKLEKIDLDEIRTDDSTTGTCDTGKSLTSTPSMSPKFTRHIREPNFDSKTPSPSVSRRSSFASIFRSKEAITSPESPTVPGKKKSTITGVLREASESLKERSGKRSRSKSRDRDQPLAVSNAPSSTESIDSRGKTKSVFSIFKSAKGDTKKIENNSPEVLSDKMAKVEFKFNDDQIRPIFEKPLEANSIRIPLHSPTHYENEYHLNLKDIQTPSQDSQDTVIEVLPFKKEETPENSNQTLDTSIKKTVAECQSRQSSTSSENIVFSTKVGSNNEIFTTKLPKEDNTLDEIQAIIEEPKLKPSDIPTDQSQETRPTNGEIVENDQIETKVENWTEVKIERTRSTTSLGKILEENQQPILSQNEIKTIMPGLFEPESNRHPLVDAERNNSSESEKDSEASSIACTIPKQKSEPDTTELLELEFNSLVVQDSFEDELPYIPTTLPLERSAAIPIVPVKQRATFEMKTCPIDRPRSTTPINPSSLDDYCEEIVTSINTENLAKSIEKLKISLPRSDSSDKTSKSPKKPRNTTWFEFAEKGIHTGRKSSTEGDTPPPLPPKGVQKEWINFEEVPERRKLPKRIQTIPSRGHIDVPDSILHDHVVYNYVNPDECKCECHEKKEKVKEELVVSTIQDDEVPLLENEPHEDKVISLNVERKKLDTTMADRRSLISDSSVDLSTAFDQHETIQADVSLQTPFKTDLDVASNRSSIASLEDPRSPFSVTPNAFSRPS